MILDSDELLVYYKSAVQKANDSIKLIVYDVLESLKEDDMNIVKKSMN